MNPDEIKPIVDRAVKNKAFRKNLVRKSLFWFLHIYFPDYLEHPVADFQKEMLKLFENNKTNLAIAAFRGSGKSTLISTAAVIWAMLGKKDKKFIVIISNTTRQAEFMMFNIKSVLETNELLKADLGPFQETAGEWKISSLVFKDYDAKVFATSTNESIRGIRYKRRRPDLIILDDVETLDSVKTEENRDKLCTWFERDIVPLGDEKTEIVMVGTIMTEGSLMEVTKNKIELGQLSGTFRKFPIIDNDGNILWKSRWSTIEDLETYKLDRGITDRSWETEYMLNDWVSEDQIIKPEMINYYDEIPFGQYPGLQGFISVDLAISKSIKADKTAILAGYLLHINGKEHLYLLPDYINKKLNSHETIEEIKRMALNLDSGIGTHIIIEDVGYQRSVAETLEEEGFYNTVRFEVRSMDKAARLQMTTHKLSNKQIHFPENTDNVLVNQLLRFGYEKHDDLADSFSMIAIKAFEIGTYKGPYMVKASGIKDYNVIGSGDWADEEDDRMFRKLGGKWRRIMG